MITRHFQEELYKLKGKARDFVAAHPKLAPLMDGAQADPDIERLFEGTGFLSARVRERLDDDYPEIIHPLIERIHPQWLRSTPAKTIVAFTPNPALRHPITIPAGARIASVPIDGITCHFRTCSDVMVHPLTLTDAMFTQPAGQRSSIRLTLALNGMRLSDWNVQSLRFFLGGSFVNAANIHLLLTRHLESISIRTLDGGGLCSLTPDKLKALGSEENEAPIIGTPSAFPGLHVLGDYFSFPEKFLFVELEGWESWRERGHGTRFEISFVFKNELPVSPPVVDRSIFVVGATLAVNLFPQDSDPIPVSGDTRRYAIQPSSKGKGHNQVWAVVGATGLLKNGMRKRAYNHQPVSGYSRSHEATFRTIVRPRPLSAGTKVVIELNRSTPEADSSEETVTAHLICTNGHLPERLGIGDIRVRTADIPESIELANIAPVTPAADPPLEANRLWHLFSLTSMGKVSLSSAGNLRSILETCATAVRRDREGVTRNLERIHGIVDLAVRWRDFIHRGQPWRGMEVTIRLDSVKYGSLGDLHLFGWALERFLGGFATGNTLVQLILEASDGNFRYCWKPRPGDQPLL